MDPTADAQTSTTVHFERYERIATNSPRLEHGLLLAWHVFAEQDAIRQGGLMNIAGAVRSAIVERGHELRSAQNATQEVYCERCHLATPVWRKRCIHCSRALSK